MKVQNAPSKYLNAFSKKARPADDLAKQVLSRQRHPGAATGVKTNLRTIRGKHVEALSNSGFHFILFEFEYRF